MMDFWMAGEAVLRGQKTLLGENNYYEFVKQANAHLDDGFGAFIRIIKRM